MKKISVEELKIIQLDILQSVHDFCIERNLKYSLAYGTLLGAVRHKGYIPWDDDIDVVMPRKDYEIFIKEYSHEFYKVYDVRKDANYSYPFAKVADTRTIIEENISMQNIGINIDLFPIDNLFDSKEECVRFVDSIIPLKKKFRYKFLLPSPKNIWWKRIAIRICKLLVLQYSLHDLAKEIHNRTVYLNSHSYSYVGMLVGTGVDVTYKEIWPKTWFVDYIEVEFEGKKFLCNKEYDKVLTQEYGEYMIPPSGKNRTSPHTLSNIYWK